MARARQAYLLPPMDASMKMRILTCDARTSSALNWSALQKEALQAIASGYKILWHLDFGLFNELKMPLGHSGQFASFCLAIDHFKETLWKEFHRFSIGAALYRGNADFLPQFPWDPALEESLVHWLKEHSQEKTLFSLRMFARNLSVEYLEQLSVHLEEAIVPFAILEELPEDRLMKALLTAPDCYGKVRLHFTNEAFDWQIEEEKALGVCMPSCKISSSEKLLPYQKIFEELSGKDYKLIPEDQLTSNWQGLDVLYLNPGAITAEGHRKVQGFIAAGGEISFAE